MSASPEKIEISFETKDGKNLGHLHVNTAMGELAKSPEKIKQIMELLNLPVGTNAKISTVVTSMMVR